MSYVIIITYIYIYIYKHMFARVGGEGRRGQEGGGEGGMRHYPSKNGP